MHYHLEIIMPRTDDIEASIEEILKPFCEHNEDDEDYSGYSFWDWYVIGGRWAGTKETCGYSPEKIEEFYDTLRKEGVTVSGLQCGKPELQPASQIPKVDRIWNDFFPTEKEEITPCPLFAHSNDQYSNDSAISCDICRVDEIPEKLTASRVIVAGPSYRGKSLEAHFMIEDSYFNEVCIVQSTWSGSVLEALEMAKKKYEGYREEWKEKQTPKNNWICVTVDYHS